MLAYFIGIKLLIAAFLLFKQSDAATQTIYPEKPNSVDPFRTNEVAFGNYTFHFRITTQIKEKPRFVITFPQIYSQVLKDPTKCFVLFKIVLQNTEINLECSLSGKNLIVDLEDYIEDLDAGYFVINLQNVQNPSGAAEKFSGNFYITSWSGLDISIDSNLSFDSIAFAPAYKTFSSVEVVNDGASTAGYLTNYLVKFGISKEYKAGTWFRLQFPQSYTIPNSVQCSMRSLNMALNCTTTNNILFIKGLNSTLAKDQVHVLKIIGVRNPYSATAKTPNFLFESLKEGINTVIDYKDDIPGIKIDAGQVTDVLIIGFPLVQNLFVDYQVKFLIMNEIPEGGSIKVVFPSTFQGLDKTCRVISGLDSAIGNTLKCVTSSLSMIITGFSKVLPQYIDLRCYAYNPPTGGPTPYFQISTFKDEAMAFSIDENPNAGFVTISSIGKPNFVNFDYYTAINNCTFSEVCPIDFRLFPKIGNGLPKSSAATYSTIDLQIPHWWWLSGQLNQPECLFGTDSTYQCWQREHIFSIQSPNTRDFEICDLPISVKYAKVTPIPGRYPWRVLTYKNGGKWNSLTTMKNTITEFATPIEQDTFMMEIPYLGISVLQAYSSSNISGDPDNLLHIRCNLQPFDLSYEGAINLNFTHVEDNLVDRAAWPSKIGFAISDNSIAEFPCKIYINGANVGIGTTNWNIHRNVRCYIKTGDSTKNENTYIQVLGFDRTLIAGAYFEMFFPNVKFCTTINRQCKLTISYTNTQDLTNPYILNQKEIVFGVVKNVPASPTFPSAITGTTTRTNDEKCQPTELRVTFSTIIADILPGDYLIIKRSLSHWYFVDEKSYNVITPSTTSLTMIAYPIQIPLLDKEYIIIPIIEKIAAGTNKLFRIIGLTTSPYAGTFDTISAVAYSSKNKIVSGDFSIMTTVLDGGIIWQGSSLSDVAGNRNGYYAFNYKQPFLFSFDTCLEVPQGGEIIATFASSPGATNFQTFDTNCILWESVKYKVGNESHSTCFWDNTSLSFKIQNFEKIAKKSRVTVQFYGTLTTQINAIQVNINTYPVKNDVSNRIDYLRTTASTISTPVPYIIAPKYEFVNWKEKKGGMYLNNRGYFKIIFDPGHDIDYNIPESNYLEFVFDASITKTDKFDCRYGLEPNGHMYPSVECNYVSGAVYNTITMKLHPLLHIKAGNKYQVIIDTRNKEIYEGLTFTKTGTYTLSVYSYVGGVKQRSGKGRFEVFGRKIPHFFIYSSNKVLDDWTLITLHSEWYLGSVALGASDLTQTSYQMMVVFFETANNGFALDLGTGLPELESFPCRVLGVNLPSTKTNVDCKLFYGYNNAPVKIEISGYTASNPSDIIVYLPLIKNPASIRVPKIWFEIQNHSLVGGVKQINVLWEGHYTELNMTYTKHAKYTYSPLEVDDSSVAIVHDQTKLEKMGILSIPIRTTGITLDAKDVIAFKLPLYWPLDVGTSILDCYNIAISNCYTITNVDRDYHMLVVTLSGSVSTGNTLKVKMRAPIAVVPLSPPAPANIISTYIFHHTRLVRIVHLKNFSGVIMSPNLIKTFSVDCEVSDPIEGDQTNYIAKFSLPDELLAAGQIRIDAYDYTQVVPYCSNTPNSLLTGNLNCGVNGNYAYLDSFNYLTKSQYVEIKIPFTNPAYNAASNLHDFKISAYFKASSGFYYLRSTSLDFTHVTPSCDIRQATSIGGANTFWAQMYHEGNFTRTNTIGPINLRISFSQTFTIDNTYYLIVKIPISFTLQTAEFVSIWNDSLFSRKWSVTKTATYNELTVYFPKTGSITAGKIYKLTLTTLNAQNNKNGFLYPNTQGTYDAPVEFYINAVLTSSSKAKIYVWKTSPLKFEAKAAVMNINEKNMYFIGFTLSASLQAGSVLKVKIPVLSYSDMNLLNQIDEDGGKDLSTGSLISCYFTSPTVAFTPVCTFTRGNKLTYQSIEITVTGITSAIAANQNIVLLVDGMKNPSSYADNNHIFTVLEIYFGGVHLYTGIALDFTLVQDTITTYSGLAAPGFNSGVIGNTNIQLTIPFKCSVALDTYSSTTGKGFGDYLIVEFPEGYVLKISSGTEAQTSATGSAFALVNIGPTNNIILYKPDRNLSANTLYTLTIRKVDQAIIKPLNAVFTVSCVKRRSVVSKNVYNPVTSYIAPTVDPTLIIITASDAINSIVPQGKHQKWTVQFQIPTTIPSVPSTGLFDLVIPATLTEPDLFCENLSTSLLTHSSENAILCSYDSVNSMYTITNFNDIVPNQNIIVTFYAKSPVSTTIGNLIIRAYKDKSRQFMLMETPQAFPTLGTSYGFGTLKMINQYGKNDALRVNSIAPFMVKVSIPAGWTATSYMDFQFDETFVSLPNYARLDCYFTEYEAQTCTVVTLSPLKIRVKAPNEPTLTVATYHLISIIPKCGDNSESGFNYLKSGSTSVILTHLANTLTLAFEILPADFTLVDVRTLFANKVENNAMYFKIRPANPIPSDGSLVITLPLYSQDGTRQIWTTNALFTSGSFLLKTCSILSTTTLIAQTNSKITCQYFVDTKKMRFVIANFQAIAAGVDLEFAINDLVLFASTDEGTMVDVIVESIDATSTSINKRYITELFGIVIRTTTSVTKSINLVRSNSILGQINVQYTFNSVDIPKVIDANSSIVFAFPNNFLFLNPISNCNALTAGSYMSFGRYIVFTPSASLAIGNFNFCMGGLTNPKTSSTTSLYVYAVYSRSYTQRLVYGCTAFTSTALTIAGSSSALSSGLLNYIDLTIDTDTALAVDAYLQIDIPSSFEVIDYELYAGLNSLTNFQRLTSPTSKLLFILTENYTKASKGVLKVKILVKNPAAASYTFSISIGESSTVSSQISSGTYAIVITALTPSMKCQLTSLADIKNSQIDVSLTTDFSGSATDAALKAPNFSNIGTCLDSDGTVSCSETVTGTFTSSTLTNLSTLTYNLQLPATAGMSILDLRIDTTNICPGMLYLTMETQFSSFSFSNLHTNIKTSSDMPTIWDFAFSPSVSIPTTEYLAVDVFNHDSGMADSLAIGSIVPCVLKIDSNVHDYASCVIQITSSYLTRISIKREATLPAGSNINLILYRVYNPTTIGTVIVFLRHYKFTTGNKAIDIAAGNAQYTTLNNAVTRTTKTAISVLAQSYNNLDLTFVTGITSTDSVFVLGTGKLCNKHSADLSALPTDSSYYGSNCASESVNLAGSPLTITNLHYSTEASTQSMYALLIEDAFTAPILKEIITIPLTVTKRAFVSLTVTQIAVLNSVIQYRFVLNIDKVVPKRTYIEILFSTPFSNIAFVSLTGVDLSKVSGSFVASSDSTRTIYLKNYDYIDAGTVEFFLYVTAKITGSSWNTGAVAIKSELDSSILFERLSLTISYAYTAPITAIIPNGFVLNNGALFVSQVGRIETLVSFKSTILTTDLLYIYPDASFAISSGRKFQCKFKQMVTGLEFFSEMTIYNSVVKRFEIAMPIATSISSNVLYLIELYSFDDMYRGVSAPSTAASYVFTFQLVSLAAAIKEQFKASYSLSNQKPSYVCFKNYISNPLNENILTLRYQPRTTIPSSAILYVHLSTQTILSGVQIVSLAPGFKQTYLDGQNIGCRATTMTLGSTTRIASSVISRCQVLYGSANEIHRNVRIKIVLNGSLSSGSLYQFDLYNLYNPATTQKFVSAWFEVWSGTAITESAFDKNILYSASPAFTTESNISFGTLTFDIQSNFPVSVPMNTAASVTLASDEDSIFVDYNTEFYQSTIATSTSTLDFHLHNANKWFFVPLSSISTNFNVAMINLYTGQSVKTVAMAFTSWIVSNKLIRKKINYTGTLIATTIPFTSMTVTSTNYIANVISDIQVSIVLSKDVSSNGFLVFESVNIDAFKPGFVEVTSVLGSSVIWTLETSSKLVVRRFNALTSGTTLTVKILILSQIVASQQISVTAFNDYPGTLTVITKTSQTISGLSTPGFPYLEATTFERPKPIRGDERGPLTFSITPTVTLNKRVDHIKIVVNVLFAVTTTEDFICTFNNLLSTLCYYDSTAGVTAFVIYAPRENNLISGTTYELKINTIRQGVFASNLDYISHPIPATYAIKADYYNLAIKSATSIQVSYIVPAYRWATEYMNTFLIQKNGYSIYRLEIKNTKLLMGNKAGRIVVDFPTLGPYGRVFEDNLGTSYYHGEEFDCLSGSKSTITFLCYIFFGNGIIPSSIIIYPTPNMVVSSVIEVFLAPILNPILDMTEAKITVSGQSFDTVKLIWVTIMEYYDYIFVAMDIPIVVVNKAMPTFTPSNKVGEKSSVTFALNADEEIKTPSAGGFDRIIMTVDKSQLVLLNKQSVVALKLLCAGWTINVYNSQRIIEFSPTTTITQGSAINLSCTTMFNQQYVIPGGVSYTLDIFSNGYIAKRYVYATNSVIPNGLTTNVVTYKNVDLEISSFDTYDFKIKPINKVPATGFLSVEFSDLFVDISNCEIYGGITGVCIIEPITGGKKRLRLALKKAYDPSVDNDIFLKVDMTNPATPATYDFNFVSYYNYAEIVDGTDYAKIDQGVLASFTYTGNTPFDYFSFDTPFSWTKECCPHNGGQFGVFQFKVGFSQDLTYDNDDKIIITSTNLYSGYHATNFLELLCYFDKDDVQYSVKSEQCVANGDQYTILIPEELTLTPTNDLLINIEYRGTNRGLVSSVVPKTYYFIITTNNVNLSNEVAIVEFPMRACYFNNVNIDVVHWNQDLSTTLEFIAYTDKQINFRPNTDGQKFRFQIVFSTWNEIKQTQHLDMGYTDLTSWNDTKTLPCYLQTSSNGFVIDGIYNPREVYCEFYRGNIASLSDPLIGTINSITDTSSLTNFRSGFGPFKNYQIYDMNCYALGYKSDGNRNTYTHITLQAQMLMDNGRYTNVHSVTQWFAIDHIKPYIDVTTLAGGSASITDMTFGIWHETYKMNIDFGTSISADYIYYDIDAVHTLKFRNQTDVQRSCSQTCNFYPADTRRYLFYFFSSATSTTLSHYSFSEAPSFANTAGIKLYATLNHALIRYITGTVKVNMVEPDMILENDYSDNPVSAHVPYRLAVYFNNPYTNTHKYMRYYIPSVFTAAEKCKVKFGFTSPDRTNPADKIQCTLTPGITFRGKTYTLMEIYNIQHWTATWRSNSYENQFIIEVWLTNPATPMWTPEWHTEWFDNYDVATNTYDSTRQQLTTSDGSNKARFWVGDTVPITNYFRVYRNRKTFEERRQSVNEWAELHLRLYPTQIIPKDTGLVEINLPSNYDIPDGGSKVCEVGHNYHADLTGQFCEITNERKIRVRTSIDKGLDPICSIVRVTTEDSVGNLNGFQAPAEWGDQSADVFLWKDTQLLEYTSSDSSSKSQKFEIGTSLNMTCILNEIDELSVLKVKFSVDMFLNAGYDDDPKQTDLFLKKPITYLVLSFNTYDLYNVAYNGFPFDLGYASTTNIPCHAVANIVPKTNENLICKIETILTSRDYYIPIKLTVENFQSIELGTNDIEFHVLDMKWTGNRNNMAWVDFGIIEKKGDGSIEIIYENTRVNLLSQAATGVVQVVAPVDSLFPSLLPNKVGAKIAFEFGFTLASYLITDDTIELKFPTHFVFPTQRELSAIIHAKNTVEDKFKTIEVLAYPMVNKLLFSIPLGFTVLGCTVAIPCEIKITVAGLRNAAYAFTSTYSLDLRVIGRQTTLIKLTYTSITPPTVSLFNSLLVTQSSEFSGDINVTYNFIFVPSYVLPTGSKLIFTLDSTLFGQIHMSSPAALCTTNFQDKVISCIITSAKIEIILSGAIEENFQGKVVITRVKNPTYIGETPANCFVLSAIHSTTFSINTGTFNSLTYKPSKNVGIIFVKIQTLSLYKTIESDYTFVLQNTNKLASNGYINLLLPKEWANGITSGVVVDRMTGSFTANTLIFSESVAVQPNGDRLLKILTQFEWPAKSQIRISIIKVKNPSIDTTQPFAVTTIYDSVVIDMSDVLDPDAKISFKPYEPKMSLVSFEFSPLNEAELAEYKIVLMSKEIITKYSIIQIIFSNVFEQIITEPLRKIICKSELTVIDTCQADARIVSFTVLKDIDLNTPFDVTIFGVINPNSSESPKISVSIKYNKAIIQFTNNLVALKTSAAPKHFPLSYLKATSLKLLEKTTYTLCMQITDSISKDAKILIDFPKQFELKDNSYNCTLGEMHDSDSFPYNITTSSRSIPCTNSNNLRRIEISGQTSSFSGGSLSSGSNSNAYQFCYKINLMENAKDAGESFNFQMRVYEPTQKMIIYRTSGILEYPSTLFYVQSGLKIFVSEVEPIPLGLMSKDVEVTLERSVPYDVYLIPSSSGFSFEPSILDFKFYLAPVRTFRINPSNTTVPGEYKISWKKIENVQNLPYDVLMKDILINSNTTSNATSNTTSSNSSDSSNTTDSSNITINTSNSTNQTIPSSTSTTVENRFSEISDTFFKVISSFDVKSITITLGQVVYKCPLNAETLPVILKLSQPSSQAFKIYYRTIRPLQGDEVIFKPKYLEIAPGQVSANLTIQTGGKAVSGLVEFSLDPEFDSIFYMPTKQLNLEILASDDTPPVIVDTKTYYITSNSAKFRISVNENAKVYYLVTRKHTPIPDKAELLDPAKRNSSSSKPSFTEYQGNKYVNITDETTSYIYNDIYEYITGLEEDTEYITYALPVDLSGNIGEIKSFEFKTSKVEEPVSFKLKSKEIIDEQQLLNSLSLISGLLPSQFKIIQKPQSDYFKSLSSDMQASLMSEGFEYVIQIDPDITSENFSPMEIVRDIVEMKDNLYEELPMLDQSFDIGYSTSEVHFSAQNFTYTPFLVDVSTFHATFNVSTTHTGNIYGIILKKNQPDPTAEQIKYGLDSQNRKLKDTFHVKTNITVDLSQKYKIWPSTSMNFTFLYHTTRYNAYFVAENDRSYKNQLMKDEDIRKVAIITKREIFVIDESKDYVSDI